MVLSDEAEKNSLSDGWMSTPRTAASCPSYVCVQNPVSVSHRFNVRSLLPEITNSLSSDTLHAFTKSSWPPQADSIVTSSRDGVISVSRILMSSSNVTASCPENENSRPVTSSTWMGVAKNKNNTGVVAKTSDNCCSHRARTAGINSGSQTLVPVFTDLLFICVLG